MTKKNQSSSKYFFLLTGENPELAVFEFESIVSSLDLHTLIKKSPDNRIIEFHLKDEQYSDLSTEIAKSLIQRITMAHFCCEQFSKITFPNNPPSTFSKLTKMFQKESVQNLKLNLTFSVKTKRIGEPFGIFKKRSITQKFSSFLGTLIQKENPGKKVDLENPNEKFIVILSQHGVWFGKLLLKSLRNEIRLRTSHNRPFFHPSSMNPILQRTMINLAALKPGEWLLDPFCGTGGTLLEASRLGIRSVGVEIDRRMIWGASRNLVRDQEFSKYTHLIFGDATHLCFKNQSLSAIVTDPPYGTAASTQGLDILELLLKFIQDINLMLKPFSRIVFAVPSDIDIENHVSQIIRADFKIFYQYVHRSLTRKILVFELTG
ncbi:MAG: DNA methyltransferase [Candidatus Hodarchaeota archaeon]